MTKQTQSIRLEPVLTATCKARASAKQMTFSEWVRTILRREAGLETRNGKRRTR